MTTPSRKIHIYSLSLNRSLISHISNVTGHPNFTIIKYIITLVETMIGLPSIQVRAANPKSRFWVYRKLIFHYPGTNIQYDLSFGAGINSGGAQYSGVHITFDVPRQKICFKEEELAADLMEHEFGLREFTIKPVAEKIPRGLKPLLHK